MAIPAVWRRIARLRARRRVGGGQWSLALLVKLDEEDARIHPSVQLLGSRLPNRAKLRLDLTDPLGVTRYTAAEAAPPSAAGRELALASFEWPGGLAGGDVVRGRGDLSLTAARRKD